MRWARAAVTSASGGARPELVCVSGSLPPHLSGFCRAA